MENKEKRDTSTCMEQSADDLYNKGIAARERKDYAEGFEFLRKASEQGHLNAQYKLGVCYYYGEGVPVDYAKAVKWYQKAAEQGHARAQCELGYCYQNGNGVPKDYKKAEELYKKAAEQGDIQAEELLNPLGTRFRGWTNGGWNNWGAVCNYS